MSTREGISSSQNSTYMALEIKRFGVLAALCVWCFSLTLVRVLRTGNTGYVFLCWNLFLAAVPLFASTAFRRLSRSSNRYFFQCLFLSIWLLFLPNAPYIVTDIVHLFFKPRTTLWLDLIMLVSYAGTGLLIGYVSVSDIHDVLTECFGVFTGWAVVLCSLLLSGFGIYLGRFHRWNSWEVVTEPWGLFGDIFSIILRPEHHRYAVAMTLVFGTALCLGYIAVRLLFGGPSVLHNSAPAPNSDAEWT
jgi:uncharacterized membrane protein